MILGTGIDFVEVARIQSAHARHGEHFLRRILRPSEIEYALQHRNPAPYLAARFAAKEAIAKAFGTGIGAELGWQDMEIGRQPSGAPFVLLHGAGAELLRARGGRVVHLSLSHTESHAIAMAILES